MIPLTLFHHQSIETRFVGLITRTRRLDSVAWRNSFLIERSSSQLGEMDWSRSTINLLISLLAICVVLQTIDALKCYQCDSSSGDLKCHWNRNFTQLSTEVCPTENAPWLGEFGCVRANVTSLCSFRYISYVRELSLSLCSVGRRGGELVCFSWVYAKDELRRSEDE